MPKRKRTARQAVTADLGTPQTQARAVVQEVKGVGRRAYVVQQTMLDRYRARGQITEQQWQAGNRFANLWHIGVGSERVCASYGQTVPGEDGASQYMLDARRTMFDLFAALTQGQRYFLVECAVYDQPAGLFGDRGMDWLRDALSAAARHWRM